VDVLSSQWRGGQVESQQIWQAFPGWWAAFWLSTPDDQVFLSTGEPLQYLAGRLIFQGLVDATECPNNGLLENGYADACGLSKARPMVDLWQNQFDPRILAVAQESGLPAQLLKNLFAQESQFWPGVFRVAKEYGLGQLTDTGADAVLLWNDSFYNQFCPLVLAEEACARGYLRLDENERAILRGALAVQANADCANCPTGIDLTHANFSVMLLRKVSWRIATRSLRRFSTPPKARLAQSASMKTCEIYTGKLQRWPGACPLRFTPPDAQRTTRLGTCCPHLTETLPGQPPTWI
jgi:hypothetical protein